MRSKSGEMVNREIIELLIAAAGIVMIILLFYNLIAPSQDKVDKTSEVFFDLFVDQISVVDDGRVGEFSIWQEPEDVKLFLIYFGNVDGNKERLTFIKDKRLYEPLVKYQYDHKNVYCVCSKEKKNHGCSYCANLASIASLEGSSGTPWKLGYNEGIKMKFENGLYNFTRIP